MCEPASFVLTKEKCFWSKTTDSHEKIIEEFGLDQDGVRGPNVVRVEITPPGGEFFRPIADWKFRLDQDQLPEWASPEDCERRARVALVEWDAYHVVRGGSRDVKNGVFWSYNNSTVRSYNNSTVRSYNNSTVTAYGNSTVTACGNSTVTAYNNSTVTAYGNSTVTAYGNSTVRSYNNSTVRSCNNSTVTAYGNSTVTAYGNSTVTAYNNSTVTACEHYSVVTLWHSATTADPVGQAVIVDRRGATVTTKTAADCAAQKGE